MSELDGLLALRDETESSSPGRRRDRSRLGAELEDEIDAVLALIVRFPKLPHNGRAASIVALSRILVSTLSLGSQTNTGLRPLKRPRRDSNPCYLRERRVS